MELDVTLSKLSLCDGKIRQSHQAALSGLSTAQNVQKAVLALGSQTQNQWYFSMGNHIKDICLQLERTCKTMGHMAINLEEITQWYRRAEAELLQASAALHATAAEDAASIGGILSDWARKWYYTWVSQFLAVLFPFFPWIRFPGLPGIIDWIKGNHKEDEGIRYKVNSIVFDDEGSYGGNQGSAMAETSEARRQELYRIIRNNLDYSMSDAELDCYLRKMNSEGCGYVALANTIFVAYAGRPEEFEKAFGYPMYRNGDLNYDALITDIYSSEDNKVNGVYKKNMDYTVGRDGPLEYYDYKSDVSGRGTTQYERADYITDFLKDRGVNVTTKTDVTVNAGNFERLSKSGKQVIISYHDGDLLNLDGSVYGYINGGHAMTVTGVTDDGYLIVSSWGKEYMIDPAGSHSGTTMTFATVEYNFN